MWSRRDDGAWSIAKGGVEDGESVFAAALREFAEETGLPLPEHGVYLQLPEVRLKSGKRVISFAIEAPDLNPTLLVSQQVQWQWPRRDGKTIHFAEVDRAQWFDTETARTKLLPSLLPMLDAILERLGPRLRS